VALISLASLLRLLLAATASEFGGALLVVGEDL
jgi:hypothetical protein